MCKNSSSLLLKDILYISGLEVNLVSARKICQAGLRGLFSNSIMYFKQGKRKVISAKMNKGLYIVNYINKALAEIAFASIKAHSEINTKMRDLILKETYSKLSKEALILYLLWHR